MLIVKKISILIPTYNEELNIEPLVTEIKKMWDKDLSNYKYEIVFIDNDSKDATREKIRKVCSCDKNIKAIFNLKNFGQFNSPYYGLQQTTGDCTIFMCADFQDPIDMIPKMVKEWEKGHKVVCCIKNKSKENHFVYMMRSLYYKMIRKFSDVEQIEHFTGFGLYDKSFIDIMKSLDDSIPFLRGIVAEYGADRKDLYYEQEKRRYGKTHNNFFSLYDAAMLSFTSYTKIGLRIATFIGFIVAFLSLAIGIVYLVLKLIFWDRFIAGLAPILIGTFFLGALQIFFIGVLGEYILTINDRVKHRPLVIERERLNFERRDGNE